jgi:hypothetical protein
VDELHSGIVTQPRGTTYIVGTPWVRRGYGGRFSLTFDGVR